MKRASIDSILENYAICEDFDGNIFNVKLKDLPHKAKEGDILKIEENSISIDYEYTKLRRKKIIDLQNEIFKNK